MIRYFCDICDREMTHERVYKLRLDTCDTQGDKFVSISPELHSKLGERYICALCANRSVSKPAKEA